MNTTNETPGAAGDERETTIPLLPCGRLRETLSFYRALGFRVTHEQEDPYPYGAVERGGVVLHFSRMEIWHSQNGACLVFVSEVAGHHRTFADALRTAYGAVPTHGSPRLTRLRPGQTRFHVFDPAGNVLLYIDRTEPAASYDRFEREQSRLQAELERAAFLRDTYTNDLAASRVLDKALARDEPEDTPLDRALALAARAELAVAMGAREQGTALQRQANELPLSDEERDRHRDELDAAGKLARWISHL